MATQAPISTPPQAYMDIIGPLIDKARGFLEAGEQLEAVAFVGNLTSRNVMPVPIQTRSGETKDESALTIQSAAALLDADFVFSITEAWSLRQDKMPQMGSMPFCVEVVRPGGPQPASGLSKPSTQAIKVVLPAPLGPITPKISPSLTRRLTSTIAGRVPPRQVLVSPEASTRNGVSTIGIGAARVGFRCGQTAEPGAVLRVRTPYVTPEFETDARVVWCRTTDSSVELGVEFLNSEDAFRARMVGQVCHI